MKKPKALWQSRRAFFTSFQNAEAVVRGGKAQLVWNGGKP